MNKNDLLPITKATNQIATIATNYKTFSQIVDSCNNSKDCVNVINHLYKMTQATDYSNESNFAVIGRALVHLKQLENVTTKKGFENMLKKYGFNMSVSNAYQYIKCFNIFEDFFGKVFVDGQMLRLLAKFSKQKYEKAKEMLLNGSIVNYDELKKFYDEKPEKDESENNESESENNESESNNEKEEEKEPTVLTLSIDEVIEIVKANGWHSLTVIADDGNCYHILNKTKEETTK